MRAIILIICFNLINGKTTTELISTTTNVYNNTIYLNQQNSIYQWESSHPYQNSDSITVESDDIGIYFISLTLEKLDIDGANGDYLLVKSGKDGVDDGRVFTDTIVNELKLLFTYPRVILEFHMNGDNNNQKYGYQLLFELIDNGMEPTLPTTTDIIWPTTAPSDSIYLTVNIAGRKANDYVGNTDDIKQSIVEMAQTYCQMINIQLTEKITKTNVLIQNLIQCPQNWLDYEKCIQLTFSLPIFYNASSNSPWNGYQLNSQHLEIMWWRLAALSLPAGLQLYELTNIGDVVKYWAILIAIIVLIFAVLLYVIKFLSTKYYLVPRRKDLNDTSPIMARKKSSNISLAPHYLQETPKIFENDFPMYKP